MVNINNQSYANKKLKSNLFKKGFMLDLQTYLMTSLSDFRKLLL